MKKNTKHKLSVLKQHTQGTGGGPAISDTLTDLEKAIIEIIGTIVQEGHEDIVETPVEFQFVSKLLSFLVFYYQIVT